MLKAIPAIGERYRDAAYYEFAEVYALKLDTQQSAAKRQRPLSMGGSGTQALLPSRWDPFLGPRQGRSRVGNCGTGVRLNLILRVRNTGRAI